MPEDRVQVCVTATSLDEDGQDVGPFSALEWPQQRVQADGFESREAAGEGFRASFNLRMDESLDADGFRFFGPIWATANVRQLEDDTWEAVSWYGPEEPCRSVAATEDEAKAAQVVNFTAAFLAYQPDQTFPRPLTVDNFDWTYNEAGRA